MNDKVLIELLRKANKHLWLHSQAYMHPGQYELMAQIKAALSAAKDHSEQPSAMVEAADGPGYGDGPAFDGYAERAGLVPAVPDGYAIMPIALTAENGAKAAMAGEFSISLQQHCPECSHEDGDIDCEICGGDVEYTETVMIDWTTIKEIYARAVDLLAASPSAKGGE